MHRGYCMPQGTEPHVTILNRQIGHHHVIICSTGPKKYSILPLSLRGANLHNWLHGSCHSSAKLFELSGEKLAR